MLHNRKKNILFLSILLIGFCVFIWLKSKEEKQTHAYYSDLKTLQDSGIIRVGIMQNSTDYYLEKGAVHGFQYEMVELMAKHLELRPHYIVYNSHWDNFQALLNNKADVLAMHLNPTWQGDQFFHYTVPHSYSKTEDLSQSWVVHKENTSLSSAIDKWLKAFVNTREYKRLQTKYFSNRAFNRRRIKHQQQTMQKTISPYDDIIKKYAKKRNLDWRFVAAIIFQESRFSPTAEGRGGSYGLMQTMPLTAQHLGSEVNFSAERQIADGCKHIYKIKKKYKDNYTNEEDLLKIALVAYNTGSGNVEAARRLAKEKDLNPNSWNDIEYVLSNVSNKSFAKRHSGIKGKVALKYVYEVWMQYTHYKNMFPEKKQSQDNN